jgi:hypothetical protein
LEIQNPQSREAEISNCKMATQVFTMHLLLLELLELKSPKISQRALPLSPPQLNPVWGPLKQNLCIVARNLLLEMEN